MPAALKVVIIRSARDRPSSFKEGFGTPLQIRARREPSPAARITVIGGVFDSGSDVEGGECFNDLLGQFFGGGGDNGRPLAEVSEHRE